jgi:hypothetical protein
VDVIDSKALVNTEIDVQISHGGDSWHVSVRDARSRRVILRFNLPHEKMARAIGTQLVTTHAEVYLTDKIGLHQHVKNVDVPISDSLTYSNYCPVTMGHVVRAWMYNNLDDAEDWTPDIPSNWNGHNYGDSEYKILLRKWSDAPTEKHKTETT